MVRFSDMLGGSGESEEQAAANAQYAALAGEEIETPAEPEIEAAIETPAEPEIEAAIETAAEPEIKPEPEPEVPALVTPEDVLDRLTRYATSARAADQVPPPPPAPPPAPEPVAEHVTHDDDAEPDEPDEPGESAEPEPLPPVGDDFLPRSKGIERRSGRGRRRRP